MTDNKSDPAGEVAIQWKSFQMGEIREAYAHAAAGGIAVHVCSAAIVGPKARAPLRTPVRARSGDTYQGCCFPWLQASVDPEGRRRQASALRYHGKEAGCGARAL
jgi:hypothetical protein